MEQCDESDEWLMAQVASGKRDRLSVLLRRYASPLLTFIRRMTGDLHQSEELFQDVFLAVWIGRHKYQYPRSFRAWLFGIAARKCRAEFRKRAHAGRVCDEQSVAEVLATDSSPAEVAVAAETAALVAAAIARLPRRQRTVVVLRHWNGLSYAEIADVVGRTEATVRSHMFHGLAAIRKYLEPRLQ